MEANHAAIEAEERFIAGDADGFLSLFDEGAQFCIPGRSRISGDHDLSEFRTVLARISAAISAGRYKPEVVCRYQAEAGMMSVLDNHVTLEGRTTKYHSVHEWIFREGRPSILLVYLHEYEVFEAAWG